MPPKAHILIIDDDANTLASLARAFRLAGHEATVCDNAARALELAKARALRPDSFRRRDAGQRRHRAARRPKKCGVSSPTVMMSGQATIEMAVRATRLGRARFSREADFDRKAAAHGRQRAAARAISKRKIAI